jgi:tetratricopeptide (TPR) repeat protein
VRVNREAYVAYLEGRHFSNKRTTESLTRARELFQKSIDIDPSYAPSCAGLVSCYELIGRAYEMKGMHSQARNVFQKFLAAAPDDPAVLALVGSRVRRVRRPRGGIADHFPSESAVGSRLCAAHLCGVGLHGASRPEPRLRVASSSL